MRFIKMWIYNKLKNDADFKNLITEMVSQHIKDIITVNKAAEVILTGEPYKFEVGK